MPKQNQHFLPSTRRNFLKTSAFLAAGSLLLPKLVRSATPANPRTALPLLSSTGPSTGLSPFRHVKDIGIQLYTVRTEMLADAVGTLKKVAQVGFKELESARSDKGNYYGLKPKEIRKICDDLGMRLRSGHIHVDNDWQKSLEEATETGQNFIISAVLPSQGQTVDHYKQSAEAFNKLGEQCKKAGLHFGYHNHDSEFATENGTVLYDVLLKYTDPSLVTMEMDLGWVVAAGHDPFQYFSAYPGRFPLWHLKDMDKVQRRSVEFGQGKVDIKGLLQHARQAGMKHFFLEQEEYAHSAFESIQIDYDYLAKLNY
jgi:sugar phosphate isomerase/epimerase